MSDDNDSGEGIADLRKQYEAQKKALAEATAELASFREGQRRAQLGDILKAKGLKPEHAEFYTADDVSEDAVSKWAEEKKALFGVAEQAPLDPFAAANAAAAERAAAVSSGNAGSIQAAPALPVGDIAAMEHAIRTLPYDDLVKLGYMPAGGTLYSR